MKSTVSSRYAMHQQLEVTDNTKGFIMIKLLYGILTYLLNTSKNFRTRSNQNTPSSLKMRNISMRNHRNKELDTIELSRKFS